MGGGLRLVAGSPAPRAAGRPLRADRAAAALARGRDGASADGGAAPGLPGAGPRLDRAPPARLWSRKGAAGSPPGPRPTARRPQHSRAWGVEGRARPTGAATGAARARGWGGRVRSESPAAAADPPPPLPAWQMTLVAGPAAGAAAAAGRTMNAAQRLGWRRDGSAARRGEAAARSAPIRGDCTDQRRAARGACDRARARCAASRRRRQEDEQLAAVCGGAGCMHEQRVLVLRPESWVSLTAFSYSKICRQLRACDQPRCCSCTGRERPVAGSVTCFKSRV